MTFLFKSKVAFIEMLSFLKPKYSCRLKVPHTTNPRPPFCSACSVFSGEELKWILLLIYLECHFIVCFKKYLFFKPFSFKSGNGVCHFETTHILWKCNENWHREHNDADITVNQSLNNQSIRIRTLVQCHLSIWCLYFAKSEYSLNWSIMIHFATLCAIYYSEKV